MATFVRYAVYYLPPDGPLARFGAEWLGWDVATGQAVAHPQVGVDVAAVTATPRKYGFHATLKPPFRLAAGTTADGLHAALEALTATLPPVRLDGLGLSRLGRFLALTARGDDTALNALAARLVADLDAFRAPASDTELARRRAAGLTPAQDMLLTRWGYPYVMDEFQFHMTLSGQLADPGPVETALAPLLERIPLKPYTIDQVALAGEREDGMFELVHRYTLSA